MKIPNSTGSCLKCLWKWDIFLHEIVIDMSPRQIILGWLDHFIIAPMGKCTVIVRLVTSDITFEALIQIFFTMNWLATIYYIVIQAEWSYFLRLWECHDSEVSLVELFDSWPRWLTRFCQSLRIFTFFFNRCFQVAHLDPRNSQHPLYSHPTII